MFRQARRITNIGFRSMASNVDSVKVEISVVLGRSVIPMHQLLRMGRGAVIELDSHQDDPVLILANDRAVAKGEIQIQGDKIAVSVVELLRGYE
jgi:flagellar motor switch protein FliN/FliY